MLQNNSTPALKSKILLKLSLAVFLSILCIAGLVLIPSVYNYERDLKNRLRDIGRSTATILFNIPADRRPSLVPKLGQAALSAPHVRGLTVIDERRLVEGSFGEAPESIAGAPELFTEEGQLSGDGAYLDIAFTNTNDKRIIAIRYDALWLKTEVHAFIWRIIGLLLLIACTVTAGSMFIVVRLIIRPILEMQANLRKASADPEHGAQYATYYRANDELGDLVSLLNRTLVDMSTNNSAEIEMRDRRFLDFAEIASDWFWEMDRDLRFSYFSDRFTDVTGVPQKKLLGVTRKQSGNPGAPSDVWERQLADLAAHRSFKGFEHPRTKSDGSVVWLSISGRPIFGEDGAFKGYRGVGADITHRVEVEQELRQAKDEAEAGSRAKSEFLSSMSHEFRTPLNAIMGFAQLLQMDGIRPLDNNNDDAVDQILKSSQHLLTLIEGLLELSKIDSGATLLSLGEFDPKPIIQDSLSMARVTGSTRGITIDFENEGSDLPLVLADSTTFKQILLNILSNAVKYNQDGGHVVVRCEESPGGSIRFIVTDNGPGIPTLRQGEVFVPFNRLGMETKATEGTGIGLAISKKKIELMEGAIGFESSEGEGSTFWFELPKSLAPLPIGSLKSIGTTDAAAAAPTGAESARRHTVMYIEGNRANLLLMRRIIGLSPELALVSVDTVEAAIRHLDTEPVDLILVDINLPRTDGSQALNKLRAGPRIPSIPILAISENATPGDVRRGLDAGFHSYLTRPLNVKTTLQAIQSALSID